jgi:hypothetical protein
MCFSNEVHMCASSIKPVRSVEHGAQLWLIGAATDSAPSVAPSRVMPFRDPDPAQIHVNGRRLDAHLKALGCADTLVMREVLRSLDWEDFRARYQLNGRPPYAPEAMLSGILLGLMRGRTSLRELERYFKLDTEVWWLTGGIAPDHAALGRFIHLHAEALTVDFFTRLTSKILDKVGKKSGKKVTALDASVITAAGSLLACCRVDKAVKAAEAAQAAANAAPDDESARKAAEKAAKVRAAGEARQQARAAAGDAPEKIAKIRVCRTDPEAAILKSKIGRFEPAVLPSVLATEDGYIVGQSVEQTDEKAAFPKVLEQARAVGVDLEAVLADGNYCRGALLELAVAEDINVITPPDKAAKSGQRKQLEPLQTSSRKLVKQDFNYNGEADTYTCPKGAKLHSGGVRVDKRRGSEARVYRPNPEECSKCPFKSRCSFSSRGLERQASEPLIEAMRDVFDQPQAREVYEKRAGIVEPCFSVIKCAMGIQRFHRFGYKSVQCEFALYVCAYNLIKMTLAIRRSRLQAARAASGPSDPAVPLMLVWAFRLACMLAALRHMRRITP